jgi:hypothetical protein
MARVISGTYHSGVYLLFPSDNPITVTGEILGPSYGIYASSDQSWNVDNQGVVSGGGGNGIDLEGGGYVLNEGTYPNRSSATIIGSTNGIQIAGGAGTVANGASITGVGGFGVLLESGGTVLNGIYGQIAGKYGVGLLADGTVTNYGIISVTGHKAVYLGANGSVTNWASIYAPVYGVLTEGTAVNVTNFGSIRSSEWAGVQLARGGSVTNGATFALTARIAGYQYGIFASGIAAVLSPATVQNDGTIVGLATATASRGVGIWLQDGGVVTNGEPGAPHPFVYGYGTGVLASYGAAVVNNSSGDITGEYGDGVDLHHGGTVANTALGTIFGGVDAVRIAGGGAVTNGGLLKGGINGNSTGIELANGGSVSNAFGGGIYATSYGILVEAAAGTASNAGRITANSGVDFKLSGRLTNAGSGTISGKQYGVVSGSGATASVNNLGSIGGDEALRLFGGGTVTNQASGALGTGLITGGRYGMLLDAKGTVTNSGSITATGVGVELAAGGKMSNAAGALVSGGKTAVFFRGSGTMSNAGTLQATLTGVGGIGTALELFSAVAINTATGVIHSSEYGVRTVYDGSSTVTNAGSISGHAAGVRFEAGGELANTSGISSDQFGVRMAQGGTIANGAAGTITGGLAGIDSDNGTAIITNSGSIGSPQVGVQFAEALGFAGALGTLTNLVGGVISGGLEGVVLFNGGTVINKLGARISSGIIGILMSGGGTVTNAGTIQGTVKSVSFGTGASRLIIAPGAVFLGKATATAGAGNVMELGSAASVGTLSGIGTNFTNFGFMKLDVGARWSLTGNNKVVAGESLTLGSTGTVTVAGSLAAAGTLRLSGSGELAVAAGGRITVGTVAATAGRINVAPVASGGTLSGLGKLAGTISDAGLIDAIGGTLTLAGDVIGAGTIAVSTHAALLAQGRVATSMKFLSGGAETLTLGAPSRATGTISGFVATDTIDLLGTLATGISFSSATHILTVSAASGTIASLLFGGSYTTASFSFGTDGHGGTKITHT